MTITLEIPAETEATLLAQAKARGLTLDAFLKTIIANHAAAAEPVNAISSLPQSGGELDRVVDEIFDTVEVPPGVGAGAMRRENWYR